MRLLLPTISALVCVLTLAASAHGQQTRIPWLTFNEVTLDRTTHVLSRHDIFPAVSALSPNHKRFAHVDHTCDGCPRSNRLMVADLRSGRDELLVQAEYGISQVAWSPDGRSIAVSTNGLWLVDASGTDFRRIAQGESDITWSPDSRYLAFTARDSGGVLSISVVSIESGATRVLARGSEPIWSPGGKNIAYTRGSKYPRCRSEIGIVAVDTGRTRSIGCGWPLSWSPDGRRIAFSRFAYSTIPLFVAPSHGGRARRLTDDVMDSRHAWSPDSKWIAFTTGFRYCRSTLAAVRVETGRTRRLATPARLVAPLAWSAGSRKVLYSAERCSDQ